MEVSELYGICKDLAASQPSASSTRKLHEVLVLACAEGCRQQGGAFGNLFSQVDFLTKRLGLSAVDAYNLQTARRHSNTGKAIDKADWTYDVKAVVRLISAVFHSAVPGELLSLLSADQRPLPTHLTINRDYVRCIVSTVDDKQILAETEDGPITIDYQDTTDGRDFSYLRTLVRPGMQLNLLDCHQDEQLIVPGQVIVEPDFLVDISSLAACFSDYGHHPYLYTIGRLKEKANSQAILLGNFAGAALDDIINQGQQASTAASLKRSFREQALRFCACPDFDPQSFKTEAERQVSNIRQAVKVLSPLLTKGQGALLEPSFVCERLGLQGRVDLMTVPTSNVQPATHDDGGYTAAGLLVEQKSGKNRKLEYMIPDKYGLQLENHYVQLLLYYGVLRYNFGWTDRQVDTRLLYSRYPAAQGLLSVNYYHSLLREALQLRNKIVATDLFMARQGPHRILSSLTADIVYKDVPHSFVFDNYVLPELERLNQQLRLISPLERAYFERMLAFVYAEQLASKLGSAETRLHHSKGCAADLWQMPLQEKLETGNILMNLRLMPISHEQMEAGEMTLSMAHQPVTTDAEEQAGEGVTPNFRPGDLVYLYNYVGEPDVRKNILFKGTLKKLAADSLTVVLNDVQHNTRYFRQDDNRTWAVEHGDSDISTNSSIRSLQRFITANPRRRDLLLGQRQPEAGLGLQLSRSYHPSYDEVLLGIRQAKDYYLLVGPPGTGKTSMALRFIIEEELAVGTSGILLMAYTNRAVDEICAMLCSLFPQAGENAVPFLRLGKVASCDERFVPYLLDSQLAGAGHLEHAQRLISQTPIIVATSAMLQSQPYILQLKHFSLAIVDEASQILEPSIIGLLASDAIDRFVLVGDHKQLPAVVQQSPEQSAVMEECLREIGLEDCRQSLFERLLHWEQRQGRTQFVGTLHSHGRMHPEVAAFPLEHFYQHEQLRAVPLPHQQEQALDYGLPPQDELDKKLMSRRVLFLETDLGDNDAEARLVADVLHRIRRFAGSHFNAKSTVGVIVPYRRQIALIRQLLADDEALSAITIDTVERYQGSQRDVIIYSFSISHIYQLDFLTATTFEDEDGTVIDRKLNVALTRARKQMIITGCRDLLCRVPLFRQLVEDYAV